MIRSHSDVTQRKIHASIFFCFLIILFPTSKHYLPSSHSDNISISVCTNHIYIYSLFGTSLFLFITKMWLLLIGAIVVLSFTHWVYSWRNPKCNGKLPPGSMGLPLLGETLQFFAPNTSSDIPPFIRKRMDRYLLRVCYVPSYSFSFSSKF